MTELNDNRQPLPASVTRFVLHWGDLGGQWGVNRSVAQIHALLYLSERPLHAEEIADQPFAKMLILAACLLHFDNEDSKYASGERS